MTGERLFQNSGSRASVSCLRNSYEATDETSHNGVFDHSLYLHLDVVVEGDRVVNFFARGISMDSDFYDRWSWGI